MDVFLDSQCDCFYCCPSASVPRRISRRAFISTAASALAFPTLALGQRLEKFDLDRSCSFYPEDKFDAEVYTFGNVSEAMEVVKRITNSAALSPNFEVIQANVPNAAAVIRGATRVILYSQVFIEQIKSRTATEWSAWTILAHEVGHHINGHTIQPGGSRPPIELEADQFAGFAVARMGGSLEQAQSPFATMSEAGSPTHPPRSARMEAVTKGWRIGKGNEAPRSPSPPTGTDPVPAPTQSSDAIAVARAFIEKVQAGSMPDASMSPQMRSVVQQQAVYSKSLLGPLGAIAGIQLASETVLPNAVKLYTYQVQFASMALSWRFWIDTTGTIVGVQYNQ